ncbi:MAG: hypothetical protein CALGDGBN_00416 [Pseudomonadales bacterium]|nr:hypothetical protein [Pseudomonadales bacterium]
MSGSLKNVVLAAVLLAGGSVLFAQTLRPAAADGAACPASLVQRRAPSAAAGLPGAAPALWVELASPRIALA